MSQRVTLFLDENTARKLRILAAEENKSMSQVIERYLQEDTNYIPDKTLLTTDRATYIGITEFQANLYSALKKIPLIITVRGVDAYLVMDSDSMEVLECQSEEDCDNLKLTKYIIQYMKEGLVRERNLCAKHADTFISDTIKYNVGLQGKFIYRKPDVEEVAPDDIPF